VHIFRLHDGRIAKMWDCGQPTPSGMSIGEMAAFYFGSHGKLDQNKSCFAFTWLYQDCWS
jgi:hypothetical protein